MHAPYLHEQFEDLDKQAHAARLGMWVFLASELLLFAGLFALYAGYRVMYTVAFAEAVAHDDVLLGTANTAILLTSSLTVALSLHACRRGRPRAAGWLLVASLGFGLTFLLFKGLEYREHLLEGIAPGAGYHYAAMSAQGVKVFYTLYYLMTGLHAFHVVVGMGLLTWLATGCFREIYSSADHVRLEVGALYWHLVDVIWIFLWPMFYLMR